MLESLLSIGVLGCLATSLKKVEDTGIAVFKRRWKHFTEGAGLSNKMDKDHRQTFEILKMFHRPYGYDALISIPFGESPSELAKHKEAMEANLRCYAFLDWKRYSGCIYARFVTVPFDDKKPFHPVKCNPWEIYCGTTMYHQDIISDMRQHPHVLVSGTTGSGKSIFIFMLLINLLCNNKPKTVQIYMTQLSSKKDLRAFSCCDHVKYYADNLSDAVKMYKHLLDKIKERNKLFNKSGRFINSIQEYNAKNPKKQMPWIYVFTDEFASYAVDTTDNDYIKEMKEFCKSAINTLAREARSAGIFLVIGIQRPDKESMPPIFKSMLCTRVAFAQNNTASAIIVVEDGEAVNLEPREALCLLGNKRHFFKTPFLNDELLELYANYYSSSEEPNYISLDNCEALLKQLKTDSKSNGKKNSKKESKESIPNPNPVASNVVPLNAPGGKYEPYNPNKRENSSQRQARLEREQEQFNKGGVIGNVNGKG